MNLQWPFTRDGMAVSRAGLLSTCAALALAAQAQIPVKIYARHLVDEVVAKNPEVMVIVMRATPPRSPDEVIIASNIGRIGKKADADDLQVLTTGKPVVKPHGKGDRFHVELVLEDASGKPIGALGTVFPYKPGDDSATFVRRAEGLRAEFRERISSIESLMELDP